MSITLYEHVNMERLNQVLNCDNIPFDPLTDETEWFEKMKKSLLFYSHRKRTNKGIKITYNQKHKHGRYSTSFGQQLMQRDIRKYIGSYRDYDFVNCHPVILQTLLKNIGCYDAFLEEYILDREATILKYKLGDKQTVIKIINNETAPQHLQLKEFHSNIYSKLIVHLLKDSANKNLLKRIKDERKKQNKTYNYLGSFFAHYLQNIENNCLMVFYDWCCKNCVPVTILMFDGLGIDKTFDISPEQIEEIETEIKLKTGFNMKITEKSAVTNWVPNVVDRVTLDQEHEEESDDFKIEHLHKLFSQCYEKDDNDKPQFLPQLFRTLVLPYFNKFVVRFKYPCMYGFRENINDDFCMISNRPDLIGLGIWSAWLASDSKINYNRSVFIVDKNNSLLKTNVYNLYKRPISEENPNIQEDCKLYFDYLSRVICGGDQKLYRYLTCWIAKMVQVGSTHQCIVLMGDMGTGKSSFSETCGFIIGETYFVPYDDIERVTTRFNGSMERAILTSVEEIVNNAGDFYKVQNTLKTIITEKARYIEKKGLEGYIIQSNNNLLLITNGFNPFNITNDNRRGCIIQVSNVEQNNSQYFIEMKKQLKANIKGIRHFFEHLDFPDNLNSIRPTTSKELELLALNRSSADKFIDTLVLDAEENRCELDNIYLDYKVFNITRNYKSIPISYFKMSLQRAGYTVEENDNGTEIVSIGNKDSMLGISITPSGTFRVKRTVNGERVSKTFKNKHDAINYRDK
jgi:hypothetical protein